MSSSDTIFPRYNFTLVCFASVQNRICARNYSAAFELEAEVKNYFRFVGSEYVILNFDKLNNQRIDSVADIDYVVEINTNPLSCFKLLKAYI